MARKGCKDRGLFERPSGSGIWWIRYTDDLGRERREKIGKSKAQARAVYQMRKAQAHQDRQNPEARRAQLARRMTVAEMIDRYLPEVQHRRSIREYIRAASYWKEAYGGWGILELGAPEVARFRARRLELGNSPATVNRHLAFLRGFYNKAIRDGLAAQNPVVQAGLLPEPEGRSRYLTPEELAAILRHLSPWHQAVVLFALWTGLRQMAMLRLRVRDLDLQAGRISVVDTRPTRGRKPTPRHLPILPEAREVAETLLANAQRRGSKWLFPGRNPEEHYAASSAIHILKKACARAGVEDLTWHDLRHTTASWIAQAGYPLQTIQLILGHRSLAMTLRYSSMAPNSVQGALGAVSAGIRAAQEKSAPKPAPASGDPPEKP